MHKFILIFLLTSTNIFANLNIVVSIPPQQTFLQAIAGDKVNITLMVHPGDSPHTYEPKPSQMKAVSKADLYFAIDVEFEHVWLPKFATHNKQMHIVDITQGIEKIQMKQDMHASKHSSHEGHHHKGDDPHIWTSPKNVKIMAQNMFEALVKFDKKNIEYYKKNLEAFLSSVTKTDIKIKSLLSSLKNNRSFMVFHPSWGYFAKEYKLNQIAVEVEGKAPSPREIIKHIKEAKAEKVTAIFTQPEFSDSAAKIIAKELSIPVVKVSPMALNWSENLIHISKTIAGKK